MKAFDVSWNGKTKRVWMLTPREAAEEVFFGHGMTRQRKFTVVGVADEHKSEFTLPDDAQ